MAMAIGVAKGFEVNLGIVTGQQYVVAGARDRPRGLGGAVEDHCALHSLIAKQLGPCFDWTRHVVSFLGGSLSGSLAKAIADASNVLAIAPAIHSAVKIGNLCVEFVKTPSRGTAYKVAVEALKFFAKVSEFALGIAKVGVIGLSQCGLFVWGTLKSAFNVIVDLVMVDEAVNDLIDRSKEASHSSEDYQLLRRAQVANLIKHVAALVFHGVGFVAVFCSIHVVAPIFLITATLSVVTMIVHKILQSRYEDAMGRRAADAVNGLRNEVVGLRAQVAAAQATGVIAA